MASGSTSAPRLASVDLRRRVCSPVVRHRLTTFALGLWVQIVCFPAQAQQANQPGYDPRQTEKRFEDQQSAQSAAGRPRLPMPQFARSAGQGGFQAAFRAAERLHHRRRRDTARPARYGLSTLYREKGIAGRPRRDRVCGQRHLSRGRLSPQPRDRSAAGHPERPVRLQVIEGSITEVALKGDGAEQFGVRADARRRCWPNGPRGLPTLERQLLLINGRPGVRIRIPRSRRSAARAAVSASSSR